MTTHVAALSMFEDTNAEPIVARGSATSFDVWYQANHARLVRALIVKCNGNQELAADAVDEAMARAFERWGRVSAMDSPEAWTFRVATNYVQRVFRRRGGERRALERTVPKSEVEELPVPSPVWVAVRNLRTRERDAITLRYVLGFTEADIATALNVKVGTASAILSRARAELRHVLSDDADGTNRDG